jgi:hypothetical protein
MPRAWAAASPAGDLHGIVDHSPRREIAGKQQVAQCRALEQLADEIRRALVRADVVSVSTFG